MLKSEAIAEYLEVEDMNDIVVWGDGVTVIAEGNEYYVLDESERDVLVSELINDSLWSFNPSFLSGCTGIDEVVFQKLAELYEGGNEAIQSIVDMSCGLSDLVDEAVSQDGYGHLISSYDGEEIELNNGYFAYKM